MIEVKKDTRQGFAIKLTLNSGSNYLTEAAALELRDKLITILPLTPSNPPSSDPKDILLEQAVHALNGAMYSEAAEWEDDADNFICAWQKYKEENYVRRDK